MEEEVNYFYSNFKKIRKDKNISINDISNKTKIQEKYIIAIEEGNLNMLPSVYTKLFLKSYSEAINLDSEKIIIEYKNHISGKIKKVITNKTPKFIEDPDLLILLLKVLIVLVAICLYSSLFKILDSLMKL